MAKKGEEKQEKKQGLLSGLLPFVQNKICRIGEKKVQITSRERGTKIAEVKTQETNKE
jgi:hypothetical protein